jgi:hypothetical protein
VAGWTIDPGASRALRIQLFQLDQLDQLDQLVSTISIALGNFACIFAGNSSGIFAGSIALTLNTSAEL